MIGQDHPVYPGEAPRTPGHRPERRGAALGGGQAAPRLLHELPLHGHAEGAPGAGHDELVVHDAVLLGGRGVQPGRPGAEERGRADDAHVPSGMM